MEQLMKPEAWPRMERLKLARFDHNTVFPTADHINPQYVAWKFYHTVLDLFLCLLAPAEAKGAKCVLGTLLV